MQADAESNSRKLRVLVADDNRDGADTLGFLLQFWGHTVCVTYSGHQALAAAPDFHPQVLLLDIGMPVIDGFSVARAVRREPALRTATVIAVTAYSDADTRRRAELAGFDLLLVKPVDPTELRRNLALIAPAT